MELLGEDGRGYELARKLETRGVWRSWLGDALYPTFIHFLSSPAAWDAFMRSPDDCNTSSSHSHLHLQLRARALLFDKASISLFSQGPVHISKLNPNYLDLHGDDVYFTLENGAQDGDQRRAGLPTNATSSKSQSKSSSSPGSRFSEIEVDAVHQRFKLEELPETWYTQFIEKYRATKSYRLMFSDRESEKRTPEQMSTYLNVLENHKRRRVAFKENLSNLRSNSVMGDDNMVDSLFFPETMFTYNCVPEGAVLQTSKPGNNKKLKFNGVLDNLPQIMTKSPMISPIMIERLGIKPEYLNIEQGHQSLGNSASQGNIIVLGKEQASKMSRKVIAQMLNNVGFDSSSESPLRILSQLLSCHISKLGRTLRVLADSYRKQCSATELLKMFLQTSGYSNLGALADLVKDKSMIVVQQSQQALGNQTQLQSQQQPPGQQSQQIFRQLSPQMLQNNHLAYQQQQVMRKRQQQQQQSTPRPAMNIVNNNNMDNKDRPLVQVKMENSSDFPLDTNMFNAMNSRNPQLQQFRQQQLAAIPSLQAQANNSFRPMASLQIPQVQSPNMGMGRAPPVKVEGFQELMGRDSSTKSEGK